MPQKTPTLYDIFDAETGEMILVAETYADARFILGDRFDTTTRSLSLSLPDTDDLPAEKFTKRVRNKREDPRVIEAITRNLKGQRRAGT